MTSCLVKASHVTTARASSKNRPARARAQLHTAFAMYTNPLSLVTAQSRLMAPDFWSASDRGLDDSGVVFVYFYSSDAPPRTAEKVHNRGCRNGARHEDQVVPVGPFALLLSRTSHLRVAPD